jgi:DNA polymerase-1
MMLQKRVAQIDSWLKAVKDDGRVHGRVITNGAVTGRMTHLT